MAELLRRVGGTSHSMLPIIRMAARVHHRKDLNIARTITVKDRVWEMVQFANQNSRLIQTVNQGIIAGFTQRGSNRIKKSRPKPNLATVVELNRLSKILQSTWVVP